MFFLNVNKCLILKKSFTHHKAGSEESVVGEESTDRGRERLTSGNRRICSRGDAQAGGFRSAGDRDRAAARGDAGEGQLAA